MIRIRACNPNAIHAAFVSVPDSQIRVVVERVSFVPSHEDVLLPDRARPRINVHERKPESGQNHRVVRLRVSEGHGEARLLRPAQTYLPKAAAFWAPVSCAASHIGSISSAAFTDARGFEDKVERAAGE